MSPECSVTASAYSSAIRSDSLKRSLCCQTSSASTLANADAPLEERGGIYVGTEAATIKPLDPHRNQRAQNWRQRRGSPIDHRIEKRDSQEDFGRARPKPHGVEYCSIFTPLVPKERPQIPRVSMKRFGRNLHEFLLKSRPFLQPKIRI